MRPESSSTVTHKNFDSEWYIWEFRFDRSRMNASIVNPDTGSRMDLPRQDRIVDGYCLHEFCGFSSELSSYLRYLQTHHILLFSNAPEIVHITDSEESKTIDDVWDEEGSFSYHTLIFRMLTGVSALPYFGFSFVDDKLYSSVYLNVEEHD